jgi:hypothetical protein
VTHTDLLKLNDAEENVLRYMVQTDKDVSLEFMQYLVSDIFTFYIHQRIYKNLPRIKEMNSNIHNREKYLSSLEGFDHYLFFSENDQSFIDIDPVSVFEILSKPYNSKNIQKNMKLLKERTSKIVETRHSGKKEKELFIDTKYGYIWAYFRDDMLVRIERADAPLPPELQGSFKETLKAIIDSEQKDNDSKIKMTLHGYSEDPDMIHSVIFSKKCQQ